MTHILSKDEVTLVSRCLAIVFRERKHKKHDRVDTCQQTDKSDKSANGTKTGKELFDAFVDENKQCYWNPHLEETVKNLHYEGHLVPHTILVSGRDIYLDTIKGAWARRAVKNLNGFSIHKIGEICGVTMSVVPQTQFTPLPEALCLAISDLTDSCHQGASLDAILNCLKDKFRGKQQPTEQIVYETLGSLIKERKIYHTGNGYHILSPDLYQPQPGGATPVALHNHHLVIGGTDSPNGLTPTLYIPLLTPEAATDKVSISCQTENDKSSSPESKGSDKEADRSLDKNDKSKSLKKFERSHSFKEKKGKKKEEKEAFTRSLSVRYGEEKAKGLVKDINLKTSDMHQDKDKGEKSSLLTKLFGRNKSKDQSPKVPEDEEPPVKEYATFSAQFPPQDRDWYEMRVQMALQNQRQPPGGNTVPKSRTWHHLHEVAPASDTELEAIYDEIHAVDCPVTRARIKPEDLSFQGKTISDLSTSQSGSWSSLTDLPEKPPLRDMPSGSGPVPMHRHMKQRNDLGIRPDQDMLYPNQNGLKDVRPKGACYMLHADSSDQESYRPTHNPHRNHADPPAKLNNNAIVTEPPTRPSHVTKVFKKYREMKCASFCSNDISVEYCGRLPNKGSAFGKSRDSGVNCVGLQKSEQKPQLYGKNHYNANLTHFNNMSSAQKDNRMFENEQENDFSHQPQLHSAPILEETDGSPTAGINPPTNHNHDHPAGNSGPFSSTPHNRSPSHCQNNDSREEYQISADGTYPTSMDSTTTGTFTSYSHSSQSTDTSYNAKDQYLDTTGSSNSNITHNTHSIKQHGENRSPLGYSEGSGTSLCSETSKQTVREVKPPLQRNTRKTSQDESRRRISQEERRRYNPEVFDLRRSSSREEYRHSDSPRLSSREIRRVSREEPRRHNSIEPEHVRRSSSREGSGMRQSPSPAPRHPNREKELSPLHQALLKHDPMSDLNFNSQQIPSHRDLSPTRRKKDHGPGGKSRSGGRVVVHVGDSHRLMSGERPPYMSDHRTRHREQVMSNMMVNHHRYEDSDEDSNPYAD